MGLIDIASTLAEVPTLLKLKKGMIPKGLDVKDCFGARVQGNAERYPNRPAVLFEDQSVTWSEFNAQANRYAHYMIQQGVQRGDTVSVIMENRIEFLALLVGLNKIGVTAGLINTNLTGKPLTHCIKVTDSRKCIFGSEIATALNEVKSELDLEEGEDYFVMPDGGEENATNWAKDFVAGAEDVDSLNPAETAHTSLGEIALYIFT
ncbi:MAG: AMP-binding protein, partial [Pseudomonadales bacterium]|nr:AMP-binding protein [Pseudomonadales bacterium]